MVLTLSEVSSSCLNHLCVHRGHISYVDGMKVDKLQGGPDGGG